MKKRGQDLLAIGLGVVALLLMGSVVWWLASRPGLRVDEKGCPTSGPTANAVLLLDASDRLSDLQRDWISVRLDGWAREVPRGGRAQVYTLGAEESPLQPDFDRCNPGDGVGADWLTANPERLRRRWETLFDTPMRGALALPDSTRPTSPLVEAVQLLSVRAGLEATARPIPRSLLVVSDLMQHSAAYSMYASGCSDPEATLRENGQRWSASLAGVSVRLLLIRREGRACEPEALVRWWRHVLARGMEVQVDRVDVVPGLAPAPAAPEPER